MFSKILIANRAEIASRIIRTCSDMGIATVAVFSVHDADAPYVHEADESLALPPGSSYLDIDTIVDTAVASGAAAIHPGYGFLAENPEFAAATNKAGLVVIGPTPETMAAMGSKIEARRIMVDAGVPVLAASELEEGSDTAAEAASIGYPLLVKASRGGGGKGMRIVKDPSQLDQAIDGASREAASSFGDGTVYLERFVERSRHIEVQILGDTYGNVVHAYDRECSVQRRFQKVIEEAPAPHLDASTRQGLWDAAVLAAEAVGYVGVGTVEFIVDSDGGFAFLEMNTRLQVEHTVTEATTGIDLVRYQIEIAQGAALPSQDEMAPAVGHAIEARLYAESPHDGFTPSTGTIHRFSIPGNVRVDTGVSDGSIVTHHYDPMLAKVIAAAPSRPEAAAKLARSLAGSEIHGVLTNRELLVMVLQHDEFLEGIADTTWLAGVADAMPARSEDSRRTHAAAAALAIQQSNRDGAKVLGAIPSGWRNVRSQPQATAFQSGGNRLDVGYVIDGRSVDVVVDGVGVPISTVHSIETGFVDLTVGRTRIGILINQVGDEVFVDSVLGADSFTRIPRFSVGEEAPSTGATVAVTPGQVVAVHVSQGDAVVAGEAVAVLESMKMEHTVVAPSSGRVVAVKYAAGSQVEAGAVLVEIEKDTVDG